MLALRHRGPLPLQPCRLRFFHHAVYKRCRQVRPDGSSKLCRRHPVAAAGQSTAAHPVPAGMAPRTNLDEELADLQAMKARRQEVRRERILRRKEAPCPTQEQLDAILSVGGEPDFATHCADEPQYFAVQVYDGDPRKAGRVAKWLGFAEKFLPPVTLSDGRQVEREVEAWLPKKKVKAHSLTTGKMASRVATFQDGSVVLFRTIMDQAMGRYIWPCISDCQEAAGADMAKPPPTMVHGYVFGDVIRQVYHIPKPCDDDYVESVRQWEQSAEVWDRMKVLRDEYGDDIPEEFLHESSARGGAADPQDLLEADQGSLSVTKQRTLQNVRQRSGGRHLEGLARERQRLLGNVDLEARELAASVEAEGLQELAAMRDKGWNVGKLHTRRPKGMRAPVVGGGRERKASPPASASSPASALQPPRPPRQAAPRRGAMASETGVASGFGDDLDFEWDPQGHVGRGHNDHRSNGRTEASGGAEEEVGSWGASGSSRGAGRGRAAQPSGSRGARGGRATPKRREQWRQESEHGAGSSGWSQSSTDDYGSTLQPSRSWYGPAAASREYYGSTGKGESGGERWYGGPSKGERYEGRSRSDGGDTRFAEANERKRSTSWYGREANDSGVDMTVDDIITMKKNAYKQQRKAMKNDLGRTHDNASKEKWAKVLESHRSEGDATPGDEAVEEGQAHGSWQSLAKSLAQQDEQDASEESGAKDGRREVEDDEGWWESLGQTEPQAAPRGPQDDLWI